MNNVRISEMTAGLLFLLIANLNAQISLPSIFTDHMVLQQKSEVPIWGWGNSRSTVKVVGSWAPQDTSVAVVGADGVFEQAEVKIKNNTVEVSSSRVKNPVFVQYCFDDATIGNLFSKEGLPVAPFRTDRKFFSDVQVSDKNHSNNHI